MMGTDMHIDSAYIDRLLEDIKVACERLEEHGLESLVMAVDNDSHYLLGSQNGRNYLEDKNLLTADFVQYCKDNRPCSWTEKRFSTMQPVTLGNAVSDKNNLNGEIGSLETEFPNSPEAGGELDLFDGDTDDYDEQDMESIDLDVLDNMYKLIKTENNQGSEEKQECGKENKFNKESNKNNGKNTTGMQKDTEVTEENSKTGSEEFTDSRELPEANESLSNNKTSEISDEAENCESEIDYECSDCKSIFKTGLDLAEHIGKEHEKLPKEGTFPCSHCGFMFAYEAHLNEHNQRNPDCILDISVKKNSDKKDFNALQHDIRIKDPKPGEKKRRKLKDILDISRIELPILCPFCEKSFERLYAYQCHILVHSNTRLRRCHICLKQFGSQSSMPRHLAVHEDRPYFCSTCYGRFENRARRDHHLSFSCKKTKHRPGLICSDCGYQTKSMSHLMIHKKKHTHVQCKCDVCGRFFRSTENLKRHLAKSHKVPFQCEICGKTFKQKDTLKRHEKEHGELKFKCEVCGKPWSELSKLNRHLKTHSGVKVFPYICEMCGHAFSRKFLLDSHRLLHTGETPFKCDVEGCVKAFRNISALKQHKEYHITYHPFMCDFCGRSFKRECLMKHHRKSHTEWQWPCDYCKEKFNSRKRFKSHVVAHHQDKIPELEKKTKMTFFKCSVCSKILSQKTVFMEHISIHKGLKPNKCGYCGKGFSTRSNMRQHEKTHTGGKKLRCTFCSKTYNDPKALEAHLNNKHQDKLNAHATTKVGDVKNVSESELQSATASVSVNADRQFTSDHHVDFKKPADFSLLPELIHSNAVPQHVNQFQQL